MLRQGSLLESGPEIEGFLYREDFITPEEELALLERIRSKERRYSITFRTLRC